MTRAKWVYVSVAALGVLAALELSVVPRTWAADAGRPARGPGMMWGQPPSTQPWAGPHEMWMMHMKMMAQLKADLEEARGAAQAEGAKTTEAKIDQALKLMREQHEAMHKHMERMWTATRERRERMLAMSHEMGRMREEMAKSGQHGPMRQKMEEMRQRMHAMCDEPGMGAMGGMGPMKCPYCGKMMGGESATTKPE
jgi:rubrerythrin